MQAHNPVSQEFAQYPQPYAGSVAIEEQSCMSIIFCHDTLMRRIAREARAIS